MPEAGFAELNTFRRAGMPIIPPATSLTYKGRGDGEHAPLEPAQRARFCRCYFLTIPSFFMRASSVVGFRPSASAAPPGPRTRQPVRSRMRKI